MIKETYLKIENYFSIHFILKNLIKNKQILIKHIKITFKKEKILIENLKVKRFIFLFEIKHSNNLEGVLILDNKLKEFLKFITPNNQNIKERLTETMLISFDDNIIKIGDLVFPINPLHKYKDSANIKNLNSIGLPSNFIISKILFSNIIKNLKKIDKSFSLHFFCDSHYNNRKKIIEFKQSNDLNNLSQVISLTQDHTIDLTISIDSSYSNTFLTKYLIFLSNFFIDNDENISFFSKENFPLKIILRNSFFSLTYFFTIYEKPIKVRKSIDIFF